ncbi:MAG: hypothetical protein Kow0059_19180 [Candidatus Sumerlaeia bacterium]
MLTMAAISMPGGWELIVILVIVLILFGPKNLPKIGGAIGRSIREFKDGLSSIGDTDDTDKTGGAGEGKKTVQPMKRERPDALPAGESAEASSPTPATTESADKRE